MALTDWRSHMGEDRGRSVDWRAVAVFYAAACAVSWPVFLVRDLDRPAWLAWDVPGWVKGLLPALGPSAGAAAALLLFRRTHRRTVSLPGTSWPRSALMVAVPVLALTAVGAGDEDPHLTGFVIGLLYSVYGLGEEFGWRGFLHDALRPLAPGRRYLLTGVMWGTWHLSTFVAGKSVLDAAGTLAVMYPLWVLASWGLGRAVDGTRSVLVASQLHLAYNYSVKSRDLLPGQAWPFLIVTAVTWVVILKTWPVPALPEETP